MWMTHQTAHVDAPLKTIQNGCPQVSMHLEHRIFLPILCNRSQNPAAGSTLNIAYTAGDRILELFALEDYIKAYNGHTVVRDMEYFLQVVALDCAKVLGHGVQLCADIHYEGLNQRQTIRVTIE
jgi:hypothetical protein